MTLAVNLAQGASNNVTFRNRIINGGMVIDQRNAGASVTLTSGGIFTVDRFDGVEDTDGAMTAQQDTSTPNGFINSLKFTTTTADASLGATQYATCRQMIEGFNCADLNWGASAASAGKTAQTVTLSFWVRSSLTGTFGGALTNGAFNRSYPFTYLISVADTWEQKTITIAGDTSGTWLTTNGIGIRVQFGLGVGSTYSGTAGAWAGAGYISATGATSVVGTNGATWYVTGVQLEAGTTASPFEYRQYGTELVLSQRYFQKISGSINGGLYQIMAICTYESANIAWGTVSLRVTMRSQPTVVYSGTYTTSYGTAGTLVSDTNQIGGDIAVIGWTGGSGGTTGYSTYLRANNSSAAFTSYSSEL